MISLSAARPYLLFLGDVTVTQFAKTAFGLRDWAPESCIGEYSLPTATVTTGLPRMTPAVAYSSGARSLVIGAAPIGGAIPLGWRAPLIEALDAGLDLVSGMHTRLEDVAELKEAATRLGRRLYNVRQPPEGIKVAEGHRRSGKRLLTVGTDCALGKKYTALSLARAFRARGVDATFRATGQTGILIAGGGIPIDAVVADFVAGAAESLSPNAAPDHWDVVEGQGSIFHPAYAGVALGLLHGTQPDVVVLCHEIGRDRVLGYPEFATPTLTEAIELTLTLGRRTNPKVRCAGVSVNTQSLNERESQVALATLASKLGMPVADSMRGNSAFEALVDACLQT